MTYLQLITLFLSLLVLTSASVEEYASIGGTLELLHVIFRHGDRTPEGVYPNDPYANEPYYPFRLGQLTNKGKVTSYSIGTTLRERYSTFIDDVYTPEVVEATSSSYNRCKASLQLVLAGLFPPKDVNIWNSKLSWQPIPYSYASQSNDKLFWASVSCPNYQKYMYEYGTTGAITAAFQQYADVIAYMNEKSGLNSDPITLSLSLYSTLKSQQEWGFRLPEWTESVWPEPLSTITAEAWSQVYATNESRILSGGFMMSKILNDTYRTVSKDEVVIGRKVYLYSGHDMNIAGVLSWLGVFQKHNPKYGAYIVFEIHNILGTRFIKVLHQNYDSSSPVPIMIPLCGYYCPLDSFVKIYEKYLRAADICGA